MVVSKKKTDVGTEPIFHCFSAMPWLFSKDSRTATYVLATLFVKMDGNE